MMEKSITSANRAGEICGDHPIDPQVVRGLVAEHRRARGGLIATLEAIQAEYGYLPEAALRLVSEGTGRPLVEVYGVATFYRSFSLKPRGRHLVCVCVGTACHVRGAPVVVQEFERQLGVKPGDTTPSREFTLDTVNCVGACALGPIVVADGRYFANANSARVRRILEKTRTGVDQVDQSTGAEAVI
jgi:NADH-quinone oxidoreductase subunit E